METKIVKLTFTGPVHFGRGRLSDGAATCDAATLFSALFIEALREGTQDELLDAVHSGRLLLSDAFPYIKDTYYLPKPMVAPSVFDKRNQERMAGGEKPDSRERKANKKLAYVSAERYASYLAGEFNSIAEQENFNLGKKSLQTKVDLTRTESDDARPYFVGGYSFNEDAGLYFLAQGSYDIRPLLEQLRFAGLGGERSSGYGRFSFGIRAGNRLLRTVRQSTGGSGTSILLSTATPREDELSDELLEGARYRLVRKGGFVQSTTHSDSPQKKRDLYLFAAGSTFTHQFEGDVFDVNATPGSHPVYRYAKAMWMEV